ncbi:hypothetical protein DFQ27_000488 [Actinomortierella ambigua]|uniref:Uncharacterized protein n=1 Tax=Actinomortierella ambigua TaxID=1343610 RepID=A0A9P6TWH4_9FUNG|nr:hypothetical protein DFQ27_000488 [Actinomortierella ambigua]
MEAFALQFQFFNEASAELQFQTLLNAGIIAKDASKSVQVNHEHWKDNAGKGFWLQRATTGAFTDVARGLLAGGTNVLNQVIQKATLQASPESSSAILNEQRRKKEKAWHNLLKEVKKTPFYDLASHIYDKCENPSAVYSGLMPANLSINHDQLYKAAVDILMHPDQVSRQKEAW